MKKIKNIDVKTKLIALIFLLSLISIYNYFATSSRSSSVSIKDTTFNIDIAKTEEEKSRGLGDIKRIPDNQGMLFVFDRPGQHGFWMWGMEFPLDIIFINGDRVVGVYENLPVLDPDESNPPIWGKQLVSDRVLEINAGLAKKYDIKVGDKVKFDILDEDLKR